MKVRAQIGMVLNLDKCIGCHTCSVTCKNVWTSRPGKPRTALPPLRDNALRMPSKIVVAPGKSAGSLPLPCHVRVHPPD